MKIKLSILIGAIILSGAVWATNCHGHDKDGDKKESSHHHRKKLDDSTKKDLIDVLKANEKLHAAFFNYDGKALEVGAKKIVSAIDKIDSKEIKKLLVFSKGKLLEMKASGDRKENNQRYHLVSMALIHIVNSYDLGGKYNAYSCPMVKKKWVQNSKRMGKVHNPYAPNMPHCGTQDTRY